MASIEKAPGVYLFPESYRAEMVLPPGQSTPIKWVTALGSDGLPYEFDWTLGVWKTWQA